jgi:hypothetical protein
MVSVNANGSTVTPEIIEYVEQTLSVPVDEIRFVNANGEVIGRIYNLGVPLRTGPEAEI